MLAHDTLFAPAAPPPRAPGLALRATPSGPPGSRGGGAAAFRGGPAGPGPGLRRSGAVACLQRARRRLLTPLESSFENYNKSSFVYTATGEFCGLTFAFFPSVDVVIPKVL
jgi:hypothetical protein